jgi:hypothetical protein
MSTKAQALLNIMSVRLQMQTEGTTNPHPAVQAATKQLVQRLSELGPDEQIHIAVHAGAAFAQYIRTATGEVLAEISETVAQEISAQRE